MSQIVWLASYPKSGNTWFRAFISNFLANRDTPLPINEFDTVEIASSRERFDDLMWAEASDMTPDEVENNRPALYRYLAAEAKERMYLKAHDAYAATPRGEPLFPAEATFGAIYFVRNPLDVAISFAHHSGTSVDVSVERMANRHYAFALSHNGLHPQLRQRLLSWSEHAISWLDQQSFPVYCMRYEDMLQNASETFRGSLEFLSLPHEPDRLARAIQFSSFGVLRRQEEESGFREKPSSAQLFFRSGQVGQWRTVLTKAQIEQIIASHGEVMRRLGYLSESGDPV